MTEIEGLYVARESFVTELDGRDEIIQAGYTVVRAGHPLLVGREDLFMPLTVHYDVEPTKTRARS